MIQLHKGHVRWVTDLVRHEVKGTLHLAVWTLAGILRIEMMNTTTVPNVTDPLDITYNLSEWTTNALVTNVIGTFSDNNFSLIHTIFNFVNCC